MPYLVRQKILLHFCQVIARPNYRVRDTYTHLAIWTNAPRGADRFCDTIFWMDVTHLESERKRFGAYFYVFMCLYANTLIRTYANARTHICAYVFCASMTRHIFYEFRGWKHRSSEGFVWRTHILLLGLREDARSEPGMTDSMLLINAGKAQEPTDSWAFPFSSLCWKKHQRFRSRWMSARR